MESPLSLLCIHRHRYTCKCTVVNTKNLQHKAASCQRRSGLVVIVNCTCSLAACTLTQRTLKHSQALCANLQAMPWWQYPLRLNLWQNVIASVHPAGQRGQASHIRTRCLVTGLMPMWPHHCRFDGRSSSDCRSLLLLRCLSKPAGLGCNHSHSACSSSVHQIVR